MAKREPEMVPAKAIVYSHKVGSVTEQRCLYVVPDRRRRRSRQVGEGPHRAGQEGRAQGRQGHPLVGAAVSVRVEVRDQERPAAAPLHFEYDTMDEALSALAGVAGYARSSEPDHPLAQVGSPDISIWQD